MTLETLGARPAEFFPRWRKSSRLHRLDFVFSQVVPPTHGAGHFR
jgi:hypothetical protein